MIKWPIVYFNFYLISPITAVLLLGCEGISPISPVETCIHRNLAVYRHASGGGERARSMGIIILIIVPNLAMRSILFGWGVLQSNSP